MKAFLVNGYSSPIEIEVSRVLAKLAPHNVPYLDVVTSTGEVLEATEMYTDASNNLVFFCPENF